VKRFSLALFVCAFALIFPAVTRAAAIVEFPIPSGGAQPLTMVYGPDGALWFAEYWVGRIGRVDTNGFFTEYPIPTSPSNPFGLVNGPDGNLWFTESYTNKIGRITTNGIFKEFSIPTPKCQPRGITVGPDGYLWFLEYAGNKIGRVDTNGTNWAEYTNGLSAIAGLNNLVTGPDGNLWFTESIVGNLGRITTNGVITEFPLPYTNSGPFGIITGPDGALWFSEFFSNKLGRITTDATPGLTNFFREFQLPTNIDVVLVTNQPYGLTVGMDGNIWFADYGGSSIGRMTTNGAVTKFFTPTTNSFPTFLTPTPDGAIWFGEYVGSFAGFPQAIARLILPVLGIAPSTNVSQVLLTWTTNAPTAQLQTNSDLTTTNWGTVTNVPVIVGGKLTVTNNVSGTLFFRLKE